MGEYRGCIKALINAHIPFEVVTSPYIDTSDLVPFEVIILPDIEAMSNREANLFNDFVLAGGILIVTGPRPSALDEYHHLLFIPVSFFNIKGMEVQDQV